MYQVKFLEIRDAGTLIPALAVYLSRDRAGDPESHWLVGAAGYGEQGCVLLTHLSGGKSTYDPYSWNDRTFSTAHHYIQDNWSKIEDGDLIDVRFILKEKDAPCESEKGLYVRAGT